MCILSVNRSKTIHSCSTEWYDNMELLTGRINGQRIFFAIKQYL